LQEAGSDADVRRLGVVPELAVADLAAAETVLADRFGFSLAARTPFDNSLSECRLGSQRIMLRRDPTAHADAHGVIDHVALKVGDTDKALAALLGRGASLVSDVTPDGPKEISEFWTAGVRYVFLQGPGRARLELCARRDGTEGLDGGILGHDHIGVSCQDISAMRTFFGALGFRDLASHSLKTASGRVDVCFMGLGDDVIEIFSLPEIRSGLITRAAQGSWARLHIFQPRESGSLKFLTGPEGLEVACWNLTK
jgi:catechol 2,3-dioxygenase-like lactoylglutathione lyase family enzyme